MGYNDPYEIHHSNEDEYSRWDVDTNGYVRNETGKSLNDVMEYLKCEIANAGIALDEYDYFQASEWERKTWPVLCRRVFAYSTPGGSEGHYIHVDVENMDGTTKSLFLGKTFMGLDHALELSNTLSRILDWNYKMGGK